MKTKSSAIKQRPAVRAFRDAVVMGLRRGPKTLPTKYLYDARGSRLFDRICQLDEYYLTRTELEIMRNHGAEMARSLGRDLTLVELGSGSSIKTRILLDHLVDPVAYVPVDISRSHLLSAADAIARSYPQIAVRPVNADFTSKFRLPRTAVAGRLAVYLPGSTIGNFQKRDARQLLCRMAELCGRGGNVLIGIDLQKEAQSIVDAYNDRKGVTAAFNLNLLRRINRELGGDFDLERFYHVAPYCHRHHRIEMHLVSRCEQVVTIGEEKFELAAEEPIRTEYSHKYTLDGFSQLAREARLRVRCTWTDEQKWFAVLCLDRLA